MKNPTALAEELSGVLATERRGLLRHIAVATPYITARTYKLFQQVKHIAHDSVEHTQRLTDLMQGLELEPTAVPFQQDVANFHFVTLESVLPLLIEEKQSQIDAYERAIGHLGDLPEARAELESLLADNREHLKQLQTAL